MQSDRRAPNHRRSDPNVHRDILVVLHVLHPIEPLQQLNRHEARSSERELLTYADAWAEGELANFNHWNTSQLASIHSPRTKVRDPPALNGRN